ncbi:transcription elongation factor B polypeptide 1-like protein [Cricetulus griseus]|nr:transcription elongation factor B polypeptide 1-like protein [Cricetulus griseus]
MLSLAVSLLQRTFFIPAPPSEEVEERKMKLLKFLWDQVGFRKNIMDGKEKTYGGCEGPDAMYVKLISSDGHEFIVKREHVLTLGTIKAMLSGPGQFAENETNEVNFREIPLHVLLKECMYFTYKFFFDIGIVGYIKLMLSCKDIDLAIMKACCSRAYSNDIILKRICKDPASQSLGAFVEMAKGNLVKGTNEKQVQQNTPA